MSRMPCRHAMTKRKTTKPTPSLSPGDLASTLPVQTRPSQSNPVQPNPTKKPVTRSHAQSDLTSLKQVNAPVHFPLPIFQAATPLIPLVSKHFKASQTKKVTAHVRPLPAAGPTGTNRDQTGLHFLTHPPPGHPGRILEVRLTWASQSWERRHSQAVHPKFAPLDRSEDFSLFFPHTVHNLPRVPVWD